MKIAVSDLKSSESNQESNKRYAIIDSDDGLELNRQHAIIRANADTERRCIQQCSAGTEMNHGVYNATVLETP